MTRKEQSGERNLEFSQWVRDKLPDSSTGYLASDLDFILCNYKTRNVMLLEVKTHKAKLRTWQDKLFRRLDSWIEGGIEDGWIYHGFHTVRFENSGFEDGRCMLDGRIISEKELIAFLSMEAQDEHPLD